jgi:hypothetical protein
LQWPESSNKAHSRLKGRHSLQVRIVTIWIPISGIRWTLPPSAKDEILAEYGLRVARNSFCLSYFCIFFAFFVINFLFILYTQTLFMSLTIPWRPIVVTLIFHTHTHTHTHTFFSLMYFLKLYTPPLCVSLYISVSTEIMLLYPS